jgi:hypothetical protein
MVGLVVLLLVPTEDGATGMSSVSTFGWPGKYRP